MSSDTNTATENTQTHTNSGNENTSAQKKSDEVVTMSQADFDTLVGRRMAKASKEATNELLSELGVESADTLKELLEQKRLQDEQSKTELEKATELNQSLQNQLEELNTQLQKTKEDNEIQSLANKHGIKEIDYFKFELSRAEKTEDFNMDTFATSLIETKGHLLGVDSVNKTVPVTHSKDNLQGAIRRADFEKMTPIEQMNAMKSGKQII